MPHDAKILTMLVPHLAPSGTRPGIISSPGSVVKDLEKHYIIHLWKGTDEHIVVYDKHM